MFQVIRALGGGNGEKRRGGLHLARPKSPNMQELKRRFRQVLSSKVKSATTLWLQDNTIKAMQLEENPKASKETPEKTSRCLNMKDWWLLIFGNKAINDRKRLLEWLKYFWDHKLSSDEQAKTEWCLLAVKLFLFLDEACGLHGLFTVKEDAARSTTTAQQTLNPLTARLVSHN